MHEMDYDGYNLKAGRLNGEAATTGTEEATDKEKQVEAGGSSSSSSSSSSSGSSSSNSEPPSKKQKTGDKADGAGAGDGGEEHEFLDLTCTTPDMKSFQQQIWQHIFAEEERELQFLKYFQTLETHTYTVSS